MNTTIETSRVWVGCLASYNNGVPHGDWFDVDSYADAEDFSGAVTKEVLETSPEPRAEEFHICDHDGFGPFPVSRYESLEDVHRKSEIMKMVDEDLLAAACLCFGAEWVLKGLMENDDWVTERHINTFAEKGEYAFEVYSEKVSPEFHRYVDWDSYEEDLSSDGVDRTFCANRFYFFNTRM